MRPIILIISFLLILSPTPRDSKSENQTQSWTIVSLKEYFDTRFDALDKAVNKAEIATEKRFEGVNEFRLQLSDQQRTFIPRSETESMFESMSKRLDDIETKMDKIDATKSGGNVVYAYVISVISTIIAIVSFGIMMMNRKNTYK